MSEIAPCAKCGTIPEPAEIFCAKCGTRRTDATPDVKDLQNRLQGLQERQQNRQKIATGRGWILAVAIFTLATGFLFFFIARSANEKEILSTEERLRSASADERAAFQDNFRRETGASWDDAVSQSRGQVRILLFVNVVLSGLYFGLWIWAKRNPFLAALLALIAYLTTICINLLIDPKMVAQGWILKILIIAGLGNAISAAYKNRKLQEESV